MSFTPVSNNNSSFNYNTNTNNTTNSTDITINKSPVDLAKVDLINKVSLKKNMLSIAKNVTGKNKSESKAEANSKAYELKKEAKKQTIEAKNQNEKSSLETEREIGKIANKKELTTVLESLEYLANTPIKTFNGYLDETAQIYRNQIINVFLRFPDMRELIRKIMLDSQKNTVFAENVKIIVHPSEHSQPIIYAIAFMLLAESAGYVNRDKIDSKAKTWMDLEDYEKLKEDFLGG